MLICSTVKDLREALSSKALSPVGFVPTMGALHAGHISLVEKSVGENPVTVVSIFVNPAQFNDRNDLENYPRMTESDIKLLSGVLRTDDIVFIPPEKEIYPGNEPEVIFDFKTLDKVMEGAFRPGHFNGVVKVVSRLFDIVMPDVAYFGQKDLQQVTIIRELVRQQNRKTRIISCPIVREPDGLAMSSRNLLLDPEIRQHSGIIFKTLSAASELICSTDISEIKEFVREQINKTPGFSLEYFEIADDLELKPVTMKTEMVPGRRYFGCIAVRAGGIRLIDNTEFNCSVIKG
ncbi:MAG TPA: pantoate--beta-alanine ligase [Bacteroidales bacterium]|nr:pantoate--beta-alanine ligase [Bacteroidales bacterium]HRT88694.1 pantoate--beta-alanine ligase [Bacteroidales bacterium]